MGVVCVSLVPTQSLCWLTGPRLLITLVKRGGKETIGITAAVKTSFEGQVGINNDGMQWPKGVLDSIDCKISISTWHKN
jgi:hypothetical protein